MSEPCFEIGLVGAGAISAGAYTGGVIDFMVQALDEWYAAKAAGTDGVPPHDVKLSVFSGASAGAITAALATGYLASNQPPVTSEAEAAANNGRNKFFDSWVDRIDIMPLLGNRDLPKKNKVMSALDSTILAEIADSGLKVTPRMARRAYVADDFHLLMTVTNLRGVPYEIQFMGGAPNAGYTMSLHADYVHFAFGDTTPPAQPDRFSLTWNEFGNDNNLLKGKLKTTALASGAFPVGLAPRGLSLVIPGGGKLDPYSARWWSVPTPDSRNPHACSHDERIPAVFGALPANYQYEYLCADGGVMDNEPLELARRLLAGSASHNPREGDKATKAIVLIDPFPGDVTFDAEYKPPSDILKLVLGLFGALKNQARFKAEELVLAAHPQVYSRFMIAPSRGGQKFPIACGALGGFGGFLKRDFRKHDYFLGRRNAQKFFMDHFVLLENNSLFSGWSDVMKEMYCVRDPATDAPVRRDNQRLLPIIPLVGAADVPCFAPQWPLYTADNLSRLCEKLEERVALVLDRLVDQYFDTNNILIRIGAGFILRRKTDEIVDFVRNKVRGELTRMGIMVT